MIILGIVLDLIILAIIAVFAFLSAKRGFVRTLIELAGFVLAIVIANSVSPVISEGVYNKMIEPAIVKSVEEIDVGDTPIGSIAEIPDDIIPEFITNIAGDNFNLQTFTDKVNENISNGTTAAVTTASQEIVKPIVTNILNIVFTLIIAVVLLFLVGILAKFINKLFSLSIIGKLNKILGAVLGMLKGGIISSVFATAISLLITVLPNGFLIFTADAIASSVIFKLLSFTNLL